MPYTSVICIGNLVRGDDGVAHRVADLIEDRLPAGVELTRVAQLDVDLSDDFADVTRVVFVDAERRGAPAVDVRPVEAEPAGEYGHALSPGHLLDIAFALYASRPSAVLVTVAAPEMGHSDTLSETAEAASIEAASEVLRLLGVG